MIGKLTTRVVDEYDSVFEVEDTQETGESDGDFIRRHGRHVKLFMDSMQYAAVTLKLAPDGDPAVDRDGEQSNADFAAAWVTTLLAA